MILYCALICLFEQKKIQKSAINVFFFNSNMEFKKVVTPEMFLPTAEDNGLLGVLHPGHYYKHNPISLPYEKRKRSTAYIKYTKGETYHYFMGGVNGGTHEAFYHLSHVCSENIKKDLDRNLHRNFITMSRILIDTFTTKR